MTIGEKIRLTRKSKNMTQVELATQAGVGVATIIRYEKGERQPSWETIRNIASVFGMTAAELLADVDVANDNTDAISDFDAADQLRADTIAKYDSLNDLGREKANEYITDLSELGKYKRS